MSNKRWELSDDEWAEFQMLRIQVRVLREACQAALAWVSNMKIVAGGERARLRDVLQQALERSRDP